MGSEKLGMMVGEEMVILGWWSIPDPFRLVGGLTSSAPKCELLWTRKSLLSGKRTLHRGRLAG